MSKEIVQINLERELPEIRKGDALGVICGLVFSVSILVLTSMGIYSYASDNPSPVGFILIPLVLVVLSYFIGWGLDSYGDDTTLLGGEMVERGADEYNRSWSGYGRERGMEGMQIGMVLIVCQFLFGAVYGCVKYLRERGSLTDDSKADIAADFVHHLLDKGRATQDQLFSLPGVQGHDVQQLRATLSILVQNEFVAQTGESFTVAPPKRYLFN